MGAGVNKFFLFAIIHALTIAVEDSNCESLTINGPA